MNCRRISETDLLRRLIAAALIVFLQPFMLGGASALALDGFDLSNPDAVHQVDQGHLGGDSAVINIGGVSRVVRAGDVLSAAELAALNQVLSGGRQHLLLNQVGAAVGGSVMLNNAAGASKNFSSFVVPTNVTVIDNTLNQELNVTGALVAHGMLLGIGDGAHAFDINAGSVYVGQHGAITTNVPSQLASVLGLVPSAVDLKIQSAGDISNSGTISSSGALAMSAGGAVNNVNLNSGAKPSITAAMQISLHSASGMITNAGTISSVNAGILLNADADHDLLVNNTGGVLSAAQAVQLREESYAGKGVVSLLGGDVNAASLDAFGGDGLVRIAANEISAPINIAAGLTDIYVAEGDLNIRTLALTGDPVIVNSGGDITLPGNANGGQTLRFAGEHLAIVAAGDVNAAPGLNLIDLSSTTKSSGNLTILAGFRVLPGTGGGTITDTSTPGATYRIGAPSLTGGDINLGGVYLRTGSDIANGNAGDIILAAHESQTYTGKGRISVGVLDATSDFGNGGDITVIAQSGPLNITQQVDSRGALNNGDITISAGFEPITNGVVFIRNGALSGGVIDFREDPGHAPVALTVSAPILSIGSVSSLDGDIALASTGLLEINGTTVVAGGELTIGSFRDSTLVNSNSSLASRKMLTVTTFGPSGSIFLGTGLTVLSEDMIFVYAEQGSILDGGGNNYTSTDGTGTIMFAAEGDVLLGADSSIIAPGSFISLANTGIASVGNDSFVATGQLLAILGSQGTVIGTNSLINAGVLAPTAPATGVLTNSDFMSRGAILILSEGFAEIGSSMTSHGGDMVVAALDGDVLLAPGTEFRANGGYISIYANENVVGANNLFHSRASGTPTNFRGGLVHISAGFSFNPDIITLGSDILSNQRAVAPLKNEILNAGKRINSFVTKRDPGFITPDLDPSGTIIDTTLVGPNVNINGNGIELGLFLPTKLGGGAIDINNSAIDITRGAIFIDSVGAAASVSLPGSVFKVESYGLVPTGLFTGFLENLTALVNGLVAEAARPHDSSTIISTDQTPTSKQGAMNLFGGSALKDEVKEENIKNGNLLSKVGKIGEAIEKHVKNLVDTDHTEARPVSAAKERVSVIATSVLAQAGVLGSLRTGGVTPNIGATNNSQPVINVGQRRSDLMFFTTANQVLSGDMVGNTEAITVAGEGTAMSMGDDKVILHTGRILTDAGKKPVTVATRLGDIKVGAGTTATISVDADRTVRVVAVGGDQTGSVEIEPNGAGQTVSIAPGEELIIAHQNPLENIEREYRIARLPLGDEENVAMAPPDSGAPSSTNTPAQKQVAREVNLIAKGQVNITEALGEQRFLHRTTIRLSGSKSSAYQRMIGNIHTAARAQKGPLPQLPPIETTLLAAQGTEPSHVVAEPGTKFKQSAPGVLELSSGAMFFSSNQAHVIKTDVGTVHVKAGAMVSLDADNGKVRIRSCSAPKAVTIKAKDHVFDLNPGQELLLAEYRPTKREALGDDGLGRRQLTVHKLTGGLTAVTGDYSIVSMLNRLRYLKPIKEGTSDLNRRTLDTVMKTSAAVEVATTSHGRYFVQEPETASAPTWVFSHGADILLSKAL